MFIYFKEELVSKFNKVVGYKVNIRKVIVFYGSSVELLEIEV